MKITKEDLDLFIRLIEWEMENLAKGEDTYKEYEKVLNRLKSIK